MISTDRERLEELRHLREEMNVGKGDPYAFAMAYPRLADDLESLEERARLGYTGMRAQ